MISLIERIRRLLDNHQSLAREGATLYAGRSGLCAHYIGCAHQEDETLQQWAFLDIIVRDLGLKWDMVTPLDPEVEVVDNVTYNWTDRSSFIGVPEFIHPFGETDDEEKETGISQEVNSDEAEPTETPSPISTDEAGDYTVDVDTQAEASIPDSDDESGVEGDASGSSEETAETSTSGLGVETKPSEDGDSCDGSEDSSEPTAEEPGSEIIEEGTSESGTTGVGTDAAIDGESESVEAEKSEEGCDVDVAAGVNQPIDGASSVESGSDGSDSIAEDYTKWETAELKAECKRLGVGVSGSRATLIKRIEKKLKG